MAQEGYRIVALSVDYGQRHRVELQAARRLAAQKLLPFRSLRAGGVELLRHGIRIDDPGLATVHGIIKAAAQLATVADVQGRQRFDLQTISCRARDGHLIHLSTPTSRAKPAR